jgi:DNA repair exonuclease SbcCD ATPase subunit
MEVPQTSAPDMVDFRHSPERPHRHLRFIVAGLIIAIAALAWVGYATLQDLARARDDLSTANASLNAANAALVTTEADLASETEAHAAADRKVEELASQVTQMQSALSHQADCTRQLADEIAELNRVSELQQVNFGRFAETSRWAAANAARDKALNNALSDYLKAYQAAFDKKYAAANSWIAAGNKQVSIANTNLADILGEIKAGNSASKIIGDALTALTPRIVATQTTCSSPG